MDVNFIKEFWLPDAEILNLKEFKTLDVLSKLEGLWLNRDGRTGDVISDWHSLFADARQNDCRAVGARIVAGRPRSERRKRQQNVWFEALSQGYYGEYGLSSERSFALH